MAVLIDIDNREINHRLDPTDNHGVVGGNMLFLDMHAKWIQVYKTDLARYYRWSHWVDEYRHGGEGVGPQPIE
jgi:hypothetical protein